MNRTPVDDAAFAHIADFYQYDADLPLKAEVIGRWQSRMPYVIEKVEYGSTRGERVPAHFAHPKEGDGPHPAVLLVHGANDFWGKNEDWAMDWLDILARQGWCVLCADFPGFGERKKAGQLAPWELDPYALRDWMVQAITDQRRGVDYLLSRPEVDSVRIGLLGGSMGGFFGTTVAGLEKRFAGVVLTVARPWPADTATDEPVLRAVHNLNFAPRISAPVLMVNAEREGRALGEELFAPMPEPKQQIWYDSSHYLPPRQYCDDILDWLGERFE